jgi:hypothetical protein
MAILQVNDVVHGISIVCPRVDVHVHGLEAWNIWGWDVIEFKSNCKPACALREGMGWEGFVAVVGEECVGL